MKQKTSDGFMIFELLAIVGKKKISLTSKVWYDCDL